MLLDPMGGLGLSPGCALVNGKRCCWGSFLDAHKSHRPGWSTPNCLSPAFEQHGLTGDNFPQRDKRARAGGHHPTHPSPLTSPLLLPEETTFEAGVKVQIHSQSEPPFVQELGFGVAPGFQTFVATQEQRVSPEFHLHTRSPPVGPYERLLLCTHAP